MSDALTAKIDELIATIRATSSGDLYLDAAGVAAVLGFSEPGAEDDDLCARLRTEAAWTLGMVAAARIEALTNEAERGRAWHLAALYATCPGVTAKDDAKAWQAQQIDAILRALHRAEAAEARVAELEAERDEARELLTIRLENMNRNGKTILDFYAVWRRQDMDTIAQLRAALARAAPTRGDKDAD